MSVRIYRRAHVFIFLSSAQVSLWRVQPPVNHTDLQGSRALCQPLSEEAFRVAACSVLSSGVILQTNNISGRQEKNCSTPAEDVKVFCTCCNCKERQRYAASDFWPAAMIRLCEREKKKVWFWFGFKKTQSWRTERLKEEAKLPVIPVL